MTSPGKWQWDLVSDDKATMTASGLTATLTGVATGTVSLTATETESGQSANVNLNVVMAEPSIYLTTNRKILYLPDGLETAERDIGEADFSMESLTGIAMSPDGHFFVSFYNDNLVAQMQDMFGADMQQCLGDPQSSATFRGPRDICLDSNGFIYVADALRNRIVRINNITGAGWTTLGGLLSGKELREPHGVFVDSLGRIYITDHVNKRVLRVDDMNGTNPKPFSRQVDGHKLFDALEDIVVDSQFRVYVSDSNTGKITQIDDMDHPDATSFKVVGALSGHPQPGQFDELKGIALDSYGRIYAVDSDVPRITRFNDMEDTSPQVLPLDIDNIRPIAILVQ